MNEFILIDKGIKSHKPQTEKEKNGTFYSIYNRAQINQQYLVL